MPRPSDVTGGAGTRRFSFPPVPNAAYYFLGFGAMPVLGLIQTKVLTVLLPPSGVGAIQLALPVLAVVVLLGSLGVPNYLLRFIPRDGPGVFGDGVAVASAGTFIVALGAMLLPFVAPELALASEPLVWLVPMFVVAAFSEQALAVGKAFLRALELHRLYNLFAVVERTASLLGVILAIWLVPSRPVTSMLGGSAIGTALALFTLAIVVKREDRPQLLSMPSRRRLGEIVRYGMPVVAVVLASSVFASSNRYVIVGAGFSTDVVARFVIGTTVATLAMQVIYEPLLTYLHPRMFRVWETGNRAAAQAMWRRGLVMYLLVAAAGGICAVLLETQIISIVATPAYVLPDGVFPPLVVSAFLLGLYRFAATHYLIARRTSELAVVFMCALASSVALALAVVGRHGLHGVATAAAIGSGVLVVIVSWRGRATLWGPQSNVS